MTAVCHYNYEYSNIFPAVFTAFCKPLLKTRCFVLCIWYILRRALIDFFYSGYSERSKVFGNPTVIKNTIPFSTCEIPTQRTKGICLDFSKLVFETKQLFGIWGLHFMSWYASFNIPVHNQQFFVGILLPAILLCPNTRMCCEHHPHRNQSWNVLT